MPIDDRLRAGLEANALSILPESEARLSALHRRRRRSRGLVAAAACAAVVALIAGVGAVVGGSDGARGPDPARTPTSGPTVSASYAGPVIPDSNWRKVITREQAVAAGADEAFLRDNFGTADRLPLTLSFLGDVYSHSGRFPGGWGVGDAGTLEYDERGRLVLTSTSPGCRGCVASFDWKITDDRLRLSGMTGDAETAIDRLMVEGVWTRYHA